MKRRDRIRLEKEFNANFKRIMAKPMEWWLDRAERALKGGIVDRRKSRKVTRRH